MKWCGIQEIKFLIWYKTRIEVKFGKNDMLSSLRKFKKNINRETQWDNGRRQLHEEHH